MKLSRRGKRTKHARRGKHTKRVGKHLRYRGKKVSGSKRYHRGHKRTYKRGKRFQRGGVCNPTIPTNVIEVDLNPSNEIVIDDNNIEFYPTGYIICKSYGYHSYGEVMDWVQKNTSERPKQVLNELKSGAYVIAFDNVPLVFTKEGFFTGTKAPGNFKVVIIEHKPSADNSIRNFRAILTRQDGNIGKPSEVYFENLASDSLDRFKEMLDNSTILDKLESNHNKKYNFNYEENRQFFQLFTRAADVLSNYVEKELKQEIYTKKQELETKKQEDIALIKKDEEFATSCIRTLFAENTTDIEQLRAFFKNLELGNMNQRDMNTFKYGTGIQITSNFNIAVKNALAKCQGDRRLQTIIRDIMIDKFYDELQTDRADKIKNLEDRGDTKYFELAKEINNRIKKMEMRILFTATGIETNDMRHYYEHNPMDSYTIVEYSRNISTLISYFEKLCSPELSEETYQQLIKSEDLKKLLL